ncbi:MAG: hypothetical protein A3J67_05350 [Parcubacteria group bacterium RIFCSPHIGHO2_02_FULL_48_10b]|nr:MAG: hypothetical protein A3J67_05350 [Parcubacteria group bacterium RIFCSPHIGHO2_02_FULL_48_10b]
MPKTLNRKTEFELCHLLFNSWLQSLYPPEYAYDTADRLLSLASKDPKNAALSSFTYTYDQLGNRLTKTTPAEQSGYAYDVLSRLLSATEKKQPLKSNPSRTVEQYAYDPAGNRLSGPKQNQAYSYDPANELLQVRDIFFTYDNNGNVVTKAEENKTFQFLYDAENKLTEAIKVTSSTASTTARYNYDPFGRRIEKNVGGKIEKFFYDNEDILFITDGTNRITQSFVHGPGIDEPLAINQTKPVSTAELHKTLSQLASVLQGMLLGNSLATTVTVSMPVPKTDTFFYLYDGLGSIIGLTDSKGKIVQKYDYDSFGNLKGQGQGSVKQPYTYTGREFDQEAGLYYYRARYYDAGVGRFLQRDPYSGFKFDVQSLNLYPYLESDI